MAGARLIVAAAAGCLLWACVGTAVAGPGRVGALAELEVDEPVDGDVVTLGGDVVLGPRARVRGHVVAVFGEVRRDPEARVEGRVLEVSSLAALQLARGGSEPSPRVVAGLRLLVAGGWLLATTLIAFAFPGRIRFGVWLAPAIGLKALVLGALVYLTAFAALLAAVGAGPTLGVPLVAAVATGFLLVKACGLAVLGAALGGRLLRRLTARALAVTFEVLLGVAVILGVRILPVVGEVAWTGVAVVALGAAVLAFALAPDRSTVQSARLGGGSGG